jgi:hypothetical protein
MSVKTDWVTVKLLIVIEIIGRRKAHRNYNDSDESNGS